MSFIWLVAWLVKGRPRVRMFKAWNNWGIALGVSLALDVLNAVGRGATPARRVKKAGVTPIETPVKEAVTASH